MLSVYAYSEQMILEARVLLKGHWQWGRQDVVLYSVRKTNDRLRVCTKWLLNSKVSGSKKSLANHI